MSTEAKSNVLDKPRLDNLAGEIWKSAVRLRGKFKQYEYQRVVLPMIVIRRLECVLEKWRTEKRAEILSRRPGIAERELDGLVRKLEQNDRSLAFHNASSWTLRKVYEEDPAAMEANFRAYLKGFSPEVQEIIDKFDYRNTIGLMAKYKSLAPIIGQYMGLAIGPDDLSPLEMGYVYEELLRRFSEQSGEEAGEHFTPREIIRLMVELLDIQVPRKRHVSIYDPACGTGGMLTVAKEHLRARAENKAERDAVDQLVTVHGQEINPSNYAICLSDILIKNDRQAKITFGNSLIPYDESRGAANEDRGDSWREPHFRFDYMLSNPPFGVTWGGKDGYEEDVRKFSDTRYKAGIPRVNDGALLFLETMLAKMKKPSEGGSRIAVVFNGSPLSNGDCGSGESEIRRWVLENDWLDAIVMLPDQLFYNTGIFTYVWILSNRKPPSHKGKVMLLDARELYEKEPKSFGNKRNRITDAHRDAIVAAYRSGWGAASGTSRPPFKIFPVSAFAYHKVAVTFWQTDAGGKPVWAEEAFDRPPTAANRKKIEAYYAPEKVSWREKDGKTFCRHPDFVEDFEYIPEGEDIEGFLEREITQPLIRWMDSPQPGYEILPNKYFYRYDPPVPTRQLIREFRALEAEADRLLKGLE